MILKSLFDYYNRKPNLAPHGYEWKEIPFIIVIDKDGNFLNLEDTRILETKQKRAKTFLVQKSKGRPGSNAWQFSNVLWDHYGYVLAHPKEDPRKSKAQNIEDAQKQHGTFVKSVNDLKEKFPFNNQFAAVNYFLSNKEQIQKVFEHQYWKDCSRIQGCNLSFRLKGESNIVAEHADLNNILDPVKNENTGAESSLDKNNKGICLITGENEYITILNTATSIPGGKSGGKLVSFQKNSGYDSYHKEQGWNAPISKIAEDAYTTALNDLLGKDSRNKFRISDTTIVFWAEKQTNFENQFSFFFTNPEKDNPNRNSHEIKALFESIYSGNINNEGDTQFYILGLAPNAARISVRFWKTGTVKEFGLKIAQHFTDLEIVKGKLDEHQYFTLFNLNDCPFCYNIC